MEKLIACMTLIVLTNCTSVKTGDLDESLLIVGPNNFVIYAPDKSKSYNTTEIYNYIDQHYKTINQIEKTITNYIFYEKRLDDLYRDGRIKKKEYFQHKDKVQGLKGKVENKRTEAQNALNEWKSLLQSSGSNTDDCYYLNIQSELFGFRTRKLTQAELDACNSCQTRIYSDGRVEYEDMNKSSCRLKKKINDETSLGHLRNGALVQLLNTDGNFYRVRDTETGKIGFIAGKYAGVSTLVKTTCK